MEQIEQFMEHMVSMMEIGVVELSLPEMEMILKRVMMIITQLKVGEIMILG